MLKTAYDHLLFGNLANYVPIQQFVQRIISGPRDAVVEIGGGLTLPCSTAEKYYWMRESFERSLHKVLDLHSDPNGVFYDIGANIGFWSLVLSSKYRHIVAFEPSPTNLKRLQHNISTNRIANVTVINSAVSNVCGELRFQEGGSMSTVTQDGEIAVSAVTLDSLPSLPRPTVMKIDVEGHAAECLAGARETLASCHPALVMELHHQQEEDDVKRELHSAGYTITLNDWFYPKRVVALHRSKTPE
jgi:FkbM family methyltransferase